MRRIIHFLGSHTELVITLLIVITIFLFVHFKQKSVDIYGVITVAKVTRYEPASSGSDTYIDIYFKGKVFSTAIDCGCRASCVGRYFFIKVNKENPTDYPLFYIDKEVPGCIIDSVKYYSGWDSIPRCP